MKTLPPLLLTLLIFSGCSEHITHGGKDANASAETNTTAASENTTLSPGGEVINGHVLPPEPDPAVNNATLLGIDTNNNGVRDDVERWIYTTYEKPIDQNVFMQTARALQVVIADPSQAKSTAQAMDDVVECMSYYKGWAEHFGDEVLIDEYRDMFEEIYPIQLNTSERFIAHERYQKELSGGVYSLTTKPEEKKSKCDFNLTNIE